MTHTLPSATETKINNVLVFTLLRQWHPGLIFEAQECLFTSEYLNTSLICILYVYIPELLLSLATCSHIAHILPYWDDLVRGWILIKPDCMVSRWTPRPICPSLLKWDSKVQAVMLSQPWQRASCRIFSLKNFGAEVTDVSLTGSSAVQPACFFWKTAER